MATSQTFTDHPQVVLNTCEDHPTECLDMYCKTCEKPTCEECLKTQHVQHDWCKLSKAARQLRSEIQNKERKLSSQANSFFCGMRKVITYIREGKDQLATENSENLESVRRDMHAMVDEIIDENVKTCRDHERTTETRMHELESKYGQQEKEIAQLATCFKTGSEKYSDFDLIELYEKFARAVSQLQEIEGPVIDLMVHKRFARNNCDRNTIKSAIGDIVTLHVNFSAVDITKFAEWNLGDTTIGRIRAKSEYEVFVQTPDMIVLIKDTGVLKDFRKKDAQCYDFAITNDDQIVLCDHKKKQVKLINKIDKCTVLFDTDDLYPTYVSVTNAGELLISMWDTPLFSYTSSSRGLVRRMTMTGQLICEYEHDKDGKTPLFHRPSTSVEHFNGHVSIIDRICNEEGAIKGTVNGFDISGKLLYQYSGLVEESAFNPIDICCDMFGNTIIADSENRTVHVVDMKGIFMKHLLSCNMVKERLNSISLYGTRLWVGTYKSGKLYTFDFCQKQACQKVERLDALYRKLQLQKMSKQ